MNIEKNVGNVNHDVTDTLHPNKSKGDFKHVEWTQLRGQSVSTENLGVNDWNVSNVYQGNEYCKT